jgi:hypothetical protein
MPKPSASRDPVLAQIDELGALENELAPYKTKIARVETLKKALRALYVDKPVEQPYERRASRFGLSVGPRGFERHIDEPKLIKLIGLKTYANYAHVTLGVIEAAVTAKVLAPDVFTQVVSTAQTGPRRLATFELEAKAA